MKFIRGMNQIVFFVFPCFLAGFGLNACGNDDEEDDGAGCASIGWIDLHAEGIVLTTDGVPIQGVHIHVARCDENSQSLSDADGVWQFNDDRCDLFNEDEIQISATDQDGADNSGLFLETLMWVPLVQTEPANMDECYYGELSATDIEIVMELDE